MNSGSVYYGLWGCVVSVALWSMVESSVGTKYVVHEVSIASFEMKVSVESLKCFRSDMVHDGF